MDADTLIGNRWLMVKEGKSFKNAFDSYCFISYLIIVMYKTFFSSTTSSEWFYKQNTNGQSKISNAGKFYKCCTLSNYHYKWKIFSKFELTKIMEYLCMILFGRFRCNNFRGKNATAHETTHSTDTKLNCNSSNSCFSSVPIIRNSSTHLKSIIRFISQYLNQCLFNNRT